MGSGGMHGYSAECVFAPDEYGERDSAARDAGEYGEYFAGLYGGSGRVLHGEWECAGGGGELCGFHRDGGEWDRFFYVDGAYL
jgi:hypothetical protein